MHVTKRIDLGLLGRELAAAAVVVNGLTHSGTDTDGELLTYPEAAPGAMPIELPPEAVPVVEAHAAPPRLTEYAGAIAVDAIVRTTDATPLEVYRLPLEQKHGYRADCTLTAIDAGNGSLRSWDARFIFKRLSAGAVRVGVVMVADIADTQASTWVVQATAQGNDMVITATGAAGRTIDWLLVGQVGRYAPAGLAPSP